MMNIRQERKEDHSGVAAVITEAFGQPNEAKLVDDLRESEHFIPELSIVAEENGKIIGHILFTKMKILMDEGDTPALTLAPVAVLPELQNRGIGSELVKKGVSECRRLGHKIIVVIGHPNYYPRFGFVSARGRGLDVPFEVSDEVFMVIELTPSALDGITGMVHFPEAFNDV